MDHPTPPDNCSLRFSCRGPHSDLPRELSTRIRGTSPYAKPLTHAAGAGLEFFAPMHRSPIFNPIHDRDATNAATETTAFAEGRALIALPPTRLRSTALALHPGTTPSSMPDT